MEAKPQKFRVVIVGGSIAGLTLAHCLWKSKIDFVVLEAYKEIAPQVGASIGILPNGARILDQLGIFDDVLNAVEPLKHSSFWTDSGKLLMSSESPKILHERHGYPTNFLDRQTLLEILYNHLGECQDRVLTNKRVVKVTHHPNHAIAECEDGSSYQGDLVVGADGIRSNVRQQMWDYMASQGLAREIESDKKAMVSEYDCVFGISPKTPELVPGHIHRTYGEGYSFLTISSKQGRVYWFFFTKMSRKYSSHEIPRFKPQDVDKHVAPWLHKPLSGSVCFRDVYEKALVKTHLALEEASFKHWSNDRIVCIGDSIHKMTPNAGQGGNSAIESAATLANSLSSLLEYIPSPQTDDIHRCLQSWQRLRSPRVTKIASSANDLTRLEACASLKHKIIGLHLMPYLKNVLLDKASADIVGAAKLDSLPLPLRSLRASMPYVNRAEVVEQQTLLERVMSTMSIFGLHIASRTTMTPLIAKVRPMMVPFFVKGFWTASNGETLDLHKSIYPVALLDRIFKGLIFCFLPSISGTDPISSLQMRPFITDVNAVYGIWLLESARDYHSPAQLILPLMAGVVFQLKGIGVWAPVYYALEYMLNPLTKLLPQNSYTVNAGTTISLLVGLLGGAYLPTYMSFTASTVESRRSWNAAWQLFPVIVPLLARIVSGLSNRVFKPKENPDLSVSAKQRSRANIFWIRAAYIGLATFSGLTWIHTLRTAPNSTSIISSIFWPGFDGHSRPVVSFMDGIARFLQYDQIFSMASGFIWLGLRFRELKQAGASFSWAGVVGTLIGAGAAFGPGVAFLLGWGWREELIHRVASSF